MSVEQASTDYSARLGASPRHAPRHLIVGESAAHRWIVKDSLGQLGAVFRFPDAAVRFARREADALGCRIIVVDRGPIELDCLAS